MATQPIWWLQDAIRIFLEATTSASKVRETKFVSACLKHADFPAIVWLSCLFEPELLVSAGVGHEQTDQRHNCKAYRQIVLTGWEHFFSTYVPPNLHAIFSTQVHCVQTNLQCTCSLHVDFNTKSAAKQCKLDPTVQHLIFIQQACCPLIVNMTCRISSDSSNTSLPFQLIWLSFDDAAAVRSSTVRVAWSWNSMHAILVAHNANRSCWLLPYAKLLPWVCQVPMQGCKWLAMATCFTMAQASLLEGLESFQPAVATSAAIGIVSFTSVLLPVMVTGT